MVCSYKKIHKHAGRSTVENTWERIKGKKQRSHLLSLFNSISIYLGQSMCSKNRGYKDEQDNYHLQGTFDLMRKADPEITVIQ